MDKAVMKVVFRARGLRVPDWVVVRRRDWLADRRGVIDARSSARSRYPLFVKPANLGSSVGISKVHEPAELGAAIDTRRRVRPQGRRRARRAGRARDRVRGARQRRRPRRRCPARSSRRASSTTTKRSTSTPDRDSRFPRRSTRRWRDEVQRQALARSRRSTAPGSRASTFCSAASTGELFLNEINTMPGFTTISMYSKLWAASGVDYADARRSAHRARARASRREAAAHARARSERLRVASRFDNARDFVLDTVSHRP